MPDTRRCNCRFAHTEGLKGHEPGCPMLLPVPPVQRDPYRLERPVAAVTGGPVHDCGESPCLHGLPEAIGTSEEFPLTSRPGEYMGIPRVPAPVTEHGVGPDGFLIHSECDACRVIGMGEWSGRVDGVPLPDETATKLGRLMLANVRIVQPPSIAELVAADIHTRTSAIGPESIPGEPDAVRAAYGALLDAAMDLRRYLQKRDGK